MYYALYLLPMTTPSYPMIPIPSPEPILPLSNTLAPQNTPVTEKIEDEKGI